MANVLATVTFEHKSGLVEDRVVNSFAFITDGTPPSGGDYDDIKTALADFYNVAPAGHNSIAAIIAPCIDRAKLAQVKMTVLDGHLDGTPHGSPDNIQQFTLEPANPGAVGLPSEVAICLSFHSSYGSDVEFTSTTRPRSRDRGRVYIGPLVTGVTSEEPTTLKCRVAQSTRETLIDRGSFLAATTPNQWCVWSRKAGLLKPVTEVSVDDAFDIQRRRGERPTLKNTASV